MRIALLTSRIAYQDPWLNFFQHVALSLGPLYLESYLHEYGPKADVLIADTLQEVLAFNPDLVGLSVTSPNYTVAQQQAREIKTKFGVPVIVGGPHITALPMTLTPDFDAGVIGEGEETFRQLVLCLSQGQWNSENLEKVDGIVFWKNGKVQATPSRASISPIDRIPKPRRVMWAKDVGIAHLVSARGCPYRCSFCTQSESMTKYRTFSPEKIVEEIKDLVDHFGVKNIRFFDDVFNISLKHIKKLSAAIRAEGLHEEVSFSAWARANTLDQEMLDALTEMNVRMLAFGFESGSDRVLSQLKTSTKVSDNVRALDLCEKAGVTVAATFIIGNPGETVEDIDATYDFVETHAHRLGDIEINPIIPLPGTALWQSALERGFVSNQMPDWSVLRDQAFLRSFDAERYIYMNDAMPYELFLTYIRKFETFLNGLARYPKVQKTMADFYSNIKPAALNQPLIIGG